MLIKQREKIVKTDQSVSFEPNRLFNEAMIDYSIEKYIFVYFVELLEHYAFNYFLAIYGDDKEARKAVKYIAYSVLNKTKLHSFSNSVWRSWNVSCFSMGKKWTLAVLKIAKTIAYHWLSSYEKQYSSVLFYLKSENLWAEFPLENIYQPPNKGSITDFINSYSTLEKGLLLEEVLLLVRQLKIDMNVRQL